VTEDVWRGQDTTPDQIEEALREMLRERHAANGALAPARVLNLVVVVDRAWKGEIANRMQRVGRYHASRTVLCAVGDGRDTLDAIAVMTYDEPSEGIGVMHEHVEIDLGPSHLAHLKTIVDPVIVSELPTVLWCPHGHEDAVDALLGLVDVILLDSDQDPEPALGLSRADELLRSAYVVDLAWLRTTPWRERLAASFDPPRRRAALDRIAAVGVRHREASTASALLLAGWLASRLGWEAAPLTADARHGLHGAARGGERDVSLDLEIADQSAPGLAGVTVSCDHGFSLSLDRAPGGLAARLHTEDGGEEKRWRVLGASRGEGGILGEGVRQALLRDPTYGPSLGAARRLCRA
jgi:glucose-6-phosphate dehydrogenase assembly protein OpcA